jgi:hypothetical protein
LKLALWSPRVRSGWVAALRPFLERGADLRLVPESAAAAPPDADLHLYDVADDPAHGYVYRALARRPGVVVLASWSLHRLVHAETAGRGDVAAYLREARRAHGEKGTFVARQVLRGLGGTLLPTLLPLNDRVLESSVGLVAPSENIRARASARLPGRPVIHLPLALEGVAPLPGRGEARRSLGLAPEEPIVTALRPGEADSPPARVAEALARVPSAVLWTSDDDPRRDERLAAADVVVALEHPVGGALPGAIASALAAGRPTLVSAGSAAAVEFPEGVVVPVSPGLTERGEVEALVRRLLEDAPLRARVGRLARAHVEGLRDPARSAHSLLALVAVVARDGAATLRALAADRAAEGTLLGWALEEVRWGARDLGIVGLPLGIEPLLGPLLGGAR